MSWWLSKSLQQVGFLGSRLKRSACRRLIRRCSWESTEETELERGRSCLRCSLSEGLSWLFMEFYFRDGWTICLQSSLQIPILISHWNGAWPWARQLPSVKATHVRNWQLRVTASSTPSIQVKNSFIPKGAPRHYNVQGFETCHSTRRNIEIVATQTKMLILSLSPFSYDHRQATQLLWLSHKVILKVQWQIL